MYVGYDYAIPGLDSTGIDMGYATNLLKNMIGVIIVIAILSIGLTILLIISNWKIFQKAKRNGWESLVPVHNMFVLMEISGTPTWHIFLSFIPWVNIYVLFRVCIDLAHKFKKSTGFGIATVFFGVICLPILAFNKKINYDFGDTSETEKKEYNQETTQINSINQVDQNFNVVEPMYNSTPDMNNIEAMMTMQNQDVVNQQVFAEPIQQTQYQQVNEMPMNYTNNDLYQTNTEFNLQQNETMNMEMPLYNENINNMETVMPTPLVQPTYEEPVNVIQNTMGVQTPELVIPTQPENIQQVPVYQEQIVPQPMESNQQFQEQVLIQPIIEQPLPNVAENQMMTNQTIMPEQINNDQNGTMM